MKKIKRFSVFVLTIFLLNLVMPTIYASENEIEKNTQIYEETSDVERRDEENSQKSEAEESKSNKQTQNIEKEEQKPNEQTQIEEENKKEKTKTKEDINKSESEEIKKQETIIQSEPTKIMQSAEIKEGIYQIKAGVGNNKYLDISEASKNNKANLQIWENSYVEQQMFKISKTEDGYYTIMAIHSEKFLDVNGAYSSDKTNVQQYEYNGTNAQKWVFKDVGQGYYNIISSLSDDKCLDVNGAYSSNGTNVQIFTVNNTAAQKFKLEEIKQTLSDKAYYKIKTNVGENKYLDIDGGKKVKGANLQIWENSDVNQQKFKVEYIKNGFYKIIAAHSQKVLDVESAGTANGTNIQQYDSNGTDAQQWFLKDLGNNRYNIISKCNNLFMDIYGAYSTNGTNVQVYTGNGTNAQIFEFVETTAPEPNDYETIEAKKTLNDGLYKIKTNIDQNKVLDISSGTAKDGANLQIWQNDNVKQQIFKLKYNESDGTYTISSPYSERVLDVASAGTTDRTNVQIYRSNNTNAQKWIINESKETGKYYIVSLCNNLFLDVYGGGSGNGTNVQMFTGNGSNAQKFIFEPYIEKDNPIVYNGTYRITTALATNMALDVSAGSTASGANVQLYNSTYVLQQKCRLTHIKDNDIYKIEFAHSGKSLAVAQDGINVIQETSRNNATNQQWKIINAGGGYYHFESVLKPGYYLDVNNSGTVNETNIKIHGKNGETAQKFKLTEIYFGVDISEHQGAIDYNALAQGIEYTIPRVGWYNTPTNELVLDKQFERNYLEAKVRNIPMGAYLYSYADSVEDARAEARALVNYLKGTGKSFELPIFFDFEDPSQSNYSPQMKTDMCKAFCEIVESAGYKVGVYSFLNWIKQMYISQFPSSYALWVASTANNDTGMLPSENLKFAGNHDIWQYTHHGRVSGIGGEVDINVTYKRMF